MHLQCNKAVIEKCKGPLIHVFSGLEPVSDARW